MNPTLKTVLNWLIAILVPVVLVLNIVRLLLTPVYPEFEYRTPVFPADRYGFTREERLEYSKIAIDYLLNDEGIEFLGDQQFADGAPMYNERELHHMVDVKVVTQAALKVWVGAWGILLALGVWAWRGGWLDAYRLALVRGGRLTAGLLAVITLFAVLAFGIAFVLFHEIFFDPGTWTFLYSDTLIRLFPERFWRDCFLYIGALSILQALLLVRAARPQPRAG